MYSLVLPEGYKIDSIHSSDIEYVVSKLEPAKNSPKMKRLMRHFITNYPNVAIYHTSIEPPHPVSCIVSSGLGSFFHLFTDEEHRGKGLAFIVGREIIRKMLAKGMTPISYVYIDNTKSQRLFEFGGYTTTGSLVVRSKL